MLYSLILQDIETYNPVDSVNRLHGDSAIPPRINEEHILKVDNQLGFCYAELPILAYLSSCQIQSLTSSLKTDEHHSRTISEPCL